jgi:tRNA(Ile)-lysidine synthase
MDGMADLLGGLSGEWIRMHATQRDRRVWALPRGELASQPRAIQRAVVREALRHLVPAIRDVGFEAVERVLRSADSSKAQDRIWMPGGVEVGIEKGEIWFRAPGGERRFRQFPQMPSAEADWRVLFPGSVDLSGGWRLSASLVEGGLPERALETARANPHRAWADAERLSAPVSVRPARAQDRFRPLGMEGHVRVMDLLASRHIPALARHRWPVVVADGSVAWVVGVRLSHEARITEGTRRVALLEVQRAPEGDEEC